jgi:hypothetical protein
MVNNHRMIRTNKLKLIDGHYVPIMGKIHHSKECRHYNFHSIDIVLSKEQLKSKGPWTTMTSI